MSENSRFNALPTHWRDAADMGIEMDGVAFALRQHAVGQFVGSLPARWRDATHIVGYVDCESHSLGQITIQTNLAGCR